jgi:hypothetical protein
MKTYGGVDVQICDFLTSALVAGEWSALSHSCYNPGTHWIEGWLRHRTDLDGVEKGKSWPYLDSNFNLCHPARNQSLYRLRYCENHSFLDKRSNNNRCRVMYFQAKRLSLLQSQRDIMEFKNLQFPHHTQYCSQKPIHRANEQWYLVWWSCGLF